VKVAWRALALLQESMEAHGAPLARGARGGLLVVKPDPALSDAERDGEAIEKEFFGGAEFDEYGRCVRGLPPCNIDGETIEDDPIISDDAWDAWRDALAVIETAGNLLAAITYPGTDDDLPPYLSESVVDSLYVSNAISNRIAGDTSEAKEHKNPYYGHDPHIIAGYCAECDIEIKVDDEHLVNNTGFIKSVIFCGVACRDALVAWQGRNR
jgi:hypothetical protein